MFIIIFTNLLVLTATFNVHATDNFSCDLYKALTREKQNTNKNICFSPFSIQTGLEMTYEGAQGATAQEIANVLHLPKNDSQRRSEKKQLLELFNNKDAPYTLACANGLWVQEKFPLKKQFLQTIKKNYRASVTPLDFTHNPHAAEKTINQAVSQQTHEHIINILPTNSLNELTRLVLINALYFKGSWQNPFDIKNTTEATFIVDAKTTVTVPLMHMPNGKFLYTETKTLQMIELEYAGDAVSMLILLPKNNNLAALEKEISPQALDAWRKELSMQTINLYVPRFTCGTTYKLNDTLMNLGIRAAFTAPTPTSGANFSGIDGKKDLYISLVAHQATLEVNEIGTVATAATAVVMNMKSMRPQQAVEFRADHPFIFLIQEKSTGTILFMGRVVNPQQK
jgi:serpin B